MPRHLEWPEEGLPPSLSAYVDGGPTVMLGESLYLFAALIMSAAYICESQHANLYKYASRKFVTNNKRERGGDKRLDIPSRQ